LQKQGIGSALVRKGLELCRDCGHRIVVVLGHSRYYPRFGFSAQLAEPLLSPFSGSDSWMALELAPGALNGITGWVHYTPPFGLGTQVRPVYRPDRCEWVRMRTALWPEGGENEHDCEITAFFAVDPFRWAESLFACKVLVAEREDAGLCGFVEASIRPHVDGCMTRPVGYVEGWYVDPDMRQKGIGRKLVHAAERWAALQGCMEIASDADLTNTVSHAAHKAVGFEQAARLVHFRKRLSAASKQSLDDPSARLRLVAIAGSFAVCKITDGLPLPAWETLGDFFCVTRTPPDEVSIVCREEVVPNGMVCERGWRCLRVAGSMPFSVVGVLASLTTPLAAAGVAVFAFSTFDTDYLLVKVEAMQAATAVLQAAGHTIVQV
jgi:aminoglycoside 6'-N-acetyltransferase I